MASTPQFETIPHQPPQLSVEVQRQRADAFLSTMKQRRSVRSFRVAGDGPFDLEVVRRCIDAAAQAPSGANKQPWTFALITSPDLKRRIRVAAEAEEQAFYGGRAPTNWLADLAPLGTDANKPFLEHAPALIVVFAQNRGQSEEEKHYYVSESVGLAVGVLLAALQHAGLATLTHTPSPMGFLSTILQRPANERAFLLIPVGLPSADCQVPDISRKPRAEYLLEY
jgi:iodotyrosine deiodinase